MRILVVSATHFEILPLLKYLKENFDQNDAFIYQKKDVVIQVLITGVGLMHTAFALAWALKGTRIDLVLNLGIGGALNSDFQIGEVYNIVSEQQADLGVEEANGSFTDLFELELLDRNQTPYINAKLYNPEVSSFKFLPTAKGVSVNKVHGNKLSIQQLKAKYDADIESMEGAAVFYACLQAGVQFLQIRSVSNYVEERNKENWNIPLAIEQLNKTATNLLDIFCNT
ncbi:MAG: futalosine hydrolase [Saprospiraceae bacterium]|nr:futalosine hydrolase [Saprospiraceae bacterium]